MEYKPFLIKVGQAGAYKDDMTYEAPFCTRESFGLWVKHVPYTIQSNIKNPVTQSWIDENGDDVFLPQTGIKSEAYELPVDFVYYENDGMANVRIAQFVERIKGKWLKIYDTYTGICRKGVYVVDFDQDPTFYRRGTHDTVIFQVKFKVNFPNLNDTF